MIFEMKYLSPVCHLLSERKKKSVKPQTYPALVKSMLFFKDGTNLRHLYHTFAFAFYASLHNMLGRKAALVEHCSYSE